MTNQTTSHNPMITSNKGYTVKCWHCDYISAKVTYKAEATRIAAEHKADTTK